MTAGIYAARQKLNILLITKSFGGQINRKAVAIENYPGFANISGTELIQRFEKHLRRQKIDIERDSVVKIKKIKKIFSVLTNSRNKFQAKAVIIASGADPRLLEIPGEKKFIGRGVSYCVACDGPLFSGKNVAVIGGGNSGFEAAISLKDWAQKIYILESSSKIKADESNQKKVKKIDKIKIITSTHLKQIKGDSFVKALIYQDKKSKKINILKVEGVFIEIGSQPANFFVRDLVVFNEKDEIIVNPRTGRTKTAGLFAAGDVTDNPFKQIVVAAGDGAKVAFSISKCLGEEKE